MPPSEEGILTAETVFQTRKRPQIWTLNMLQLYLVNTVTSGAGEPLGRAQPAGRIPVRRTRRFLAPTLPDFVIYHTFRRSGRVRLPDSPPPLPSPGLYPDLNGPTAAGLRFRSEKVRPRTIK